MLRHLTIVYIEQSWSSRCKVFIAFSASVWRSPSLHLSNWSTSDEPGTNDNTPSVIGKCSVTRHARVELQVRA
jgi:hypothetical protein